MGDAGRETGAGGRSGTAKGKATRAPLPEGAIEALRSGLRGALCLPGNAGYEQARTLWNGMIDRHPAAVARVAGAADVRLAVKVAGEHGLLLAVRGGGHNIAGNASCDGGLMIDLSLMKSVRIDPFTRTARVEPGVILGELDREAQAFGLVTPLGVNSTTGVAGLTLGGGFGWLSRKFGLTVDNLLSVDVVTADGELLHASERENPELFWAVRGGGGNFGVVTSFEFRLHRFGPDVLSGLIVHPIAKAREVLDGCRRLAATAPDELTVWCVMRKAPPLPFLAPEHHGSEILVMAVCWAGDDLRAGEEAIARLRALGEPLGEAIGPTPYVGWQTAFDPLATPGARNYWKSHDLLELSDPAVEAMLEAASRAPTPDCEVLIAQLGGAVNRVPAEATAYPHRDVQYIMNIHTRWTDPADDARCIAWARALFDAVAPHATGGVYVNFMPEDEVGRVGGAYGPSYGRLARIKARHDPGNLFRLNQNIQPAS